MVSKTDRIYHEQVWSANLHAHVDKKMRDILEWLNSRGAITYYSCQGQEASEDCPHGTPAYICASASAYSMLSSLGKHTPWIEWARVPGTDERYIIPRRHEQGPVLVIRIPRDRIEDTLDEWQEMGSELFVPRHV